MRMELMGWGEEPRLPAHVRRELERIEQRTFVTARRIQGLDLLGRISEAVVLNQAVRQTRAENPATALALAEVGEVVRLGVLTELTRYSMSA